MPNKLRSPKIFLLDAFGALLSAFFLGFVLVKLNNLIGMPDSVLYILALVPMILFTLDLVFYRWFKAEWRPYIRVIAVANAVYASVSLILLFFHADQLKFLGWLYFISEIILLLYIVYLEFKVSAD